jgi:hypothetical protein
VRLSLSLGSGSEEAAESVRFDGPPGLVPLLSAVTRCQAIDFALSECSPNSQVGVATVTTEEEGEAVPLGTAAVYSLVGGDDELGRLGLRLPVLDSAVTGPLSLLRAGEYGMEMALEGFPESDPLASLEMTLWGVPASEFNDEQRLPKGTAWCAAGDSGCGGEPVPSSLSPRPLLTNPTTCPEPRVVPAPVWTLAVDTHEDPSPSTTSATQNWTTGCDQLGFNPSFSVAAARSIGARSGLDVDFDVPQGQSVTSPSPSQLRAAEVEFEGGVELLEDELGRGTVGTAEIESPIFEAPLIGEVEFGGSSSGPAYELEVRSASHGVDLRLPLELEADPETGNLVVRLPELPQLPLERIDLAFFGGQSAPFLTYGRCETYETTAWFEARDEEFSLQSATSSLPLDEGFGGGPCPGPAAQVAVTVTPGSVPADGSSKVEARAGVTDARGRPVLEDDLRFSSSDPGQRVSGTYELFDGAYGADILASRVGGPVTVTATDFSVAPPISGSAVMTQLEAGCLCSMQIRQRPRTRFTAKPPKRSRKRRATFRFRTRVKGSTYSCRLDGRRFRHCRSPLTLRRLRPGRHTFQVFATGPTGIRGAPATYTFRVKPPLRKHGAA